MIQLLKRIYMGLIKLYSAVVSKRKTVKQVVYLMSFPDNNDLLVSQLSKSNKVVVYYTNKEVINEKMLNELSIKYFSLKSFKGLIKAVKDVSRSQVTVCDNYFPFLGAIKKIEDRKILQIWHATGAIKCFGLEDRQLVYKSKSDINRFSAVYRSFDYYAVASEAMAEVFKKSYGAKENQMLYLGFPRTDALFKETITKKTIRNEKKIILYLPTYREGQKELPPLDIQKMKSKLSDEYQLYIKLHPHVANLSLNQVDDNFVKWHSNKQTEDLIKEADVLITDYSSVAYDYALIHPKGKLIFYWYDKEEYNQVTGLQSNVEETLPSKVCMNEEEIIESLLDESDNQLEKFNQIWNTYNDGQSVQRVSKVVERWMWDTNEEK